MNQSSQLHAINRPTRRLVRLSVFLAGFAAILLGSIVLSPSASANGEYYQYSTPGREGGVVTVAGGDVVVGVHNLSQVPGTDLFRGKVALNGNRARHGSENNPSQTYANCVYDWQIQFSGVLDPAAPQPQPEPNVDVDITPNSVGPPAGYGEADLECRVGHYPRGIFGRGAAEDLVNTTVTISIAPNQNPGSTNPGNGANGNPQCAVRNFGPVSCPLSYSGIDPQSNNCYVRDPGAPNSNFALAQCTDPAFKPIAAIVCSATTDPAVRAANCDPALNCTENCNLTKKYINPLIKAVAAIVGIGVTLSIIVAGIQYASSANDPQKVAAAKRRIINSLLTLIGFFLLFSFLNYIIPGGIGI